MKILKVQIEFRTRWKIEIRRGKVDLDGKIKRQMSDLFF